MSTYNAEKVGREELVVFILSVLVYGGLIVLSWDLIGDISTYAGDIEASRTSGPLFLSLSFLGTVLPIYNLARTIMVIRQRRPWAIWGLLTLMSVVGIGLMSFIQHYIGMYAG